MKRLTNKHPLMKKLEKIWALMEKEGVSIQFGPYGELALYLKDYKDDFRMWDLEAEVNRGTGHQSEIHQFPPMMEYKVLVDKD